MNSVVKPRPWIFIRDLQDQVNQLFETNLTERTQDSPKMALNQWSPHVDIKEDKDKYVIYADVPGVEPKDINVNIENNCLIIRGERSIENRSEQDNYSRSERLSGTFYRRFTLPDNIDEAKVVAKGKNGVLTIDIPKAEPNSPKKITVNLDGDS